MIVDIRTAREKEAAGCPDIPNAGEAPGRAAGGLAAPTARRAAAAGARRAAPSPLGGLAECEGAPGGQLTGRPSATRSLPPPPPPSPLLRPPCLTAPLPAPQAS